MAQRDKGAYTIRLSDNELQSLYAGILTDCHAPPPAHRFLSRASREMS